MEKLTLKIFNEILNLYKKFKYRKTVKPYNHIKKSNRSKGNRKLHKSYFSAAKRE